MTSNHVRIIVNISGLIAAVIVSVYPDPINQLATWDSAIEGFKTFANSPYNIALAISAAIGFMVNLPGKKVINE